MILPTLVWRPSPNFRKGRSERARLIIIHDEEGTYGGSAARFLDPHAAVSAHLAVREDGKEVTQYVALGDTAWHVRSCNPYCVGVEMPGFIAKGFPQVELDADAQVAAWLLMHLGLPCRWAQHGQGSGFCSHYDLHGVGGNTHTDPTTDEHVWEGYVQRIQTAYAGLKGMTPNWPGVK